MDSLFEFLFKFRPIVFEQGEFAFAAPSDVRTWLGIAGVIGASAVTSSAISAAWRPAPIKCLEHTHHVDRRCGSG